MSTNRERKEVVVAELKEKFSKAGSAVLINYIGLNVEEDTNLRNKFRAAGVEYKVIKNTMINLATRELGVEGLEAYLEGPTAVAFSYDDPTAASRVINDFIKETKKTEIKAAILGTSVLNAKGAEALANIPSKEVLLAQLFSVMNGPARGLVTVLSGPARGLVTALSAIKDQKSA